MENKKQVKFDIDNGKVFYCDEAAVVHNPTKVILDFRSVTPRVDIRNNEFQPVVIKHDVVMMDVFTAKNFLAVLQENLANYEKTFGKIEKPKSIQKLEKMSKPVKKGNTKTETPNYFG